MTSASVTGTGLQREWQACAAIARLALSKRASQGSNWLSWSLLVLGVLIAAGAGYGTGQWGKAIGLGAGVPLSMLAWLWWHYLIETVRNQNHPAAHKLAPGLARRSRMVLLAAWLALSVSVGLLMALAVGLPLLCCLAAGLVLAVSGAMIRWQFTVIFVFLCSLPYLAGQLGMDPDSVGASLDLYGLAAISAAVIAICAAVIASALGRVAPPSMGHFTITQFPLYWRYLRADCARGDRVRLLMHALGPQGHSKTQAIVVAAGLAAGILMTAVVDMPLAVARTFFLSGALALQFAIADRLAAVIYARSREQSLLRLAVHAPDAKQFNTMLSGAIVRQFLAWWAGTTVVALGFSYLTGVSGRELLSLFAVFCITLLAGGTLLRDYARKPRYGVGAKAAVVTLFIFTNAMLMVAVAAEVAAGWWIGLAGACVAAGAAFMAFRQRAMLRAPAAFPAGRMA